MAVSTFSLNCSQKVCFCTVTHCCLGGTVLCLKLKVVTSVVFFQVFRTDFITAMKLPDSAQLGLEEFYFLSDPWRQEWEKGVQVPANVDVIPEPAVR